MTRRKKKDIQNIENTVRNYRQKFRTAKYRKKISYRKMSKVAGMKEENFKKLFVGKPTKRKESSLKSAYKKLLNSQMNLRMVKAKRRYKTLPIRAYKTKGHITTRHFFKLQKFFDQTTSTKEYENVEMAMQDRIYDHYSSHPSILKKGAYLTLYLVFYRFDDNEWIPVLTARLNTSYYAPNEGGIATAIDSSLYYNIKSKIGDYDGILLTGFMPNFIIEWERDFT